MAADGDAEEYIYIYLCVEEKMRKRGRTEDGPLRASCVWPAELLIVHIQDACNATIPPRRPLPFPEEKK